MKGRKKLLKARHCATGGTYFIFLEYTCLLDTISGIQNTTNSLHLYFGK